MMKNDSGPDVTFCHLKSDLMERSVKGDDINIINHDIASSNTSRTGIWQDPIY